MERKRFSYILESSLAVCVCVCVCVCVSNMHAVNYASFVIIVVVGLFILSVCLLVLFFIMSLCPLKCSLGTVFVLVL